MISKLSMKEEILKGDYILRTEEDSYTQMIERETKRNRNKKILFMTLYISILVISLLIV